MPVAPGFQGDMGSDVKGDMESDEAELGGGILSVAFVSFPDSEAETGVDSDENNDEDSEAETDVDSEANRADLGTLHPDCRIFIQGASCTGPQPLSRP